MSTRKNILIILLIAGSSLLGYLFSSLIAYLILALVFATILRPVQDFLENLSVYGLKMPKAIAVTISLILLVGTFSGLAFLLVPLVYQQVELISNLDLEDITDELKNPLFEIEMFLINNQIVEQEPGFIQAEITKSIRGFFLQLDLKSILNSIVSITGSILLTVTSVLFITFFMLLEKGMIKNLLLKTVPNAYFELTVSTLFKIEKLLSNYLIGIFLQMAGIFSLVAIGLTIIGTKYAFTIALFCAITNLIPYLGPIIGDVFALFIGLSSTPIEGGANEYIFFIIKMLSVLFFTQFMDNTFMQPIIFSKSVKAHPLEIFLVVFAGGILSGPVGMIAAIPVYTILRVTTVEFYRGYKSFTIFNLPKSNNESSMWNSRIAERR